MARPDSAVTVGAASADWFEWPFVGESPSSGGANTKEDGPPSGGAGKEEPFVGGSPSSGGADIKEDGPPSGGAESVVIKEEPSWSCWASGRGRGRRGGQAALQVGHYAARI